MKQSSILLSSFLLFACSGSVISTGSEPNLSRDPDASGRDDAANQNQIPPDAAADPNRVFNDVLGFTNLGNTCFANSALKLLWVATRDDLAAFTSQKLTITTFETNEMLKARVQIQKAFFVLMSQLSDNSKNERKKTDHYTPELNALFDRMEDYLKLRNGSNDPYFAMDGSNKVYIRKDQIDSQEFLSFLADLLEYSSFYGTLTTQQVSTFTNNQIYDGGTDATSPLALRSFESDMQVAWNKYTAAETIAPSARLTDPTGANRVESTRATVPILDGKKDPSQLILQLGRFSYSSGGAAKIDTKVGATDPLKITFFNPNRTSNKIDPVGESLMRLDAVVVHHGSVGGGHYVAYVRDDQRKGWVLHNDSSATMVDPAKLKDQLADGYLFLYRKASYRKRP